MYRKKIEINMGRTWSLSELNAIIDKRLTGIATSLQTSKLVPVNVSNASSPEVGQVLTATSKTTASWKNSSGGAPLGTSIPIAESPGATGVVGNENAAAHADHVHALPPFGTSAGTFCEGNDSRIGGGAPLNTLVSVQTNIDLITTANTVIDTRPSSPPGPGRWKLVSIDLRVLTPVSGAPDSFSNVKIGSTPGGSEIILNQVIMPTSVTGDIVGGLSLMTLGTDMGQLNGFEAIYPASKTIYASVSGSGTLTSGEITAYLLWQGLP